MKNKALISYETILVAKTGNSEAINQILQHYEPYIARCAQRTFHDDYGNQYQVVDTEIKNRIIAKLMFQIIYAFDPFKLPPNKEAK